jgi:hypothetical protein
MRATGRMLKVGEKTIRRADFKAGLVISLIQSTTW